MSQNTISITAIEIASGADTCYLNIEVEGHWIELGKWKRGSLHDSVYNAHEIQRRIEIARQTYLNFLD